jgi:hypothetical protein
MIVVGSAMTPLLVTFSSRRPTRPECTGSVSIATATVATSPYLRPLWVVLSMPVLGTSATDSRSQRKDRAVDPTGRRTGSREHDEGLTAAPSNDRTVNHSAAFESPHVDSALAPLDHQWLG